MITGLFYSCSICLSIPTKEEYQRRVTKAWENISRLSLKDVSLKYPKRFANLMNCSDSTGDHLIECGRCKNCFDLKYGEDCKYIYTGNKSKDCYDCSYLGYPLELGYEAVTSPGYQVRFSLHNYDNLNISYCIDSYNSENLFGCIGLSKAKYCILNKQYSKEEYMRLEARIIKHMNEMPYQDKKGRIYKYGEFFPIELSPFAYNETVAQEVSPLAKDEVFEKGYRWKEQEERRISKSITNEIVQCAHAGRCNEQCTSAFRIIPQEFKFYKKMNIPLPRLCPNCRHYQRLKQRNPFRLWHRFCHCAVSSDLIR